MSDKMPIIMSFFLGLGFGWGVAAILVSAKMSDYEAKIDHLESIIVKLLKTLSSNGDGARKP